MVDGVSCTIPGRPSLMRRIMLMLTPMGLRKNPEQAKLDTGPLPMR
jgi:hypothetical protein